MIRQHQRTQTSIAKHSWTDRCQYGAVWLPT